MMTHLEKRIIEVLSKSSVLKKETKQQKLLIRAFLQNIKKREKDFVEAMTETLVEYEYLIENTSKYVKKWRNYGRAYSCRICLVMTSCFDCPLSFCEDDTFRSFNIALIKYFRCGRKKHLLEEVRLSAEARYHWLLSKIDEEGYEYK
jgi:hypothetical protein